MFTRGNTFKLRKRVRITLSSGLGQLVIGGILFTLILTMFGIARCQERAWADQQRDLLSAIRNGDHDGSEALVLGGVDPKGIVARRETALHHAVRAAGRDPDWNALVRQLLTHGADSCNVDKNGITPLAMTLLADSPEVITILVEGGADPNETLPTVMSVLAMGTLMGKDDAAEALQAAGGGEQFTARLCRRWRTSPDGSLHQGSPGDGEAQTSRRRQVNCPGTGSRAGGSLAAASWAASRGP